MTLVDGLEPKGDDRVAVRLEGGDRLVVASETAAGMGLEAGRELTGAEVERLREASARREALDRAFSYLSHRPRSRFEVERHLRSKGFEPAAVAHALSRCEELGYLDDRAFAESWVRDRIRLKPRGRFKLRMELEEKGVSEGDAEAAIDRVFRDEEIDERALLERAARKRWEARRADDPEKLRRRLHGYLRRRGFRSADIHEVLDGLLPDR